MVVDNITACVKKNIVTESVCEKNTFCQYRLQNSPL